MFQCTLIVAVSLTLDSDGAISEESPSAVICTTRVVMGIRSTQVVDCQLQVSINNILHHDATPILNKQWNM